MSDSVVKVRTNNSFVDLHIHTNFSNVHEDYGNLSLTPEELMEQLYKNHKETNAKITISVTDHDSIEAVKIIEKLQQEHPEYKAINVITGCEFTASTKSLGVYADGESKYGQIHLLGYDFDIHNELLNYYFSLKDLREGNTFILGSKRNSFGSIVLAAINVFNKYANNKESKAKYRELSLEDFVGFNVVQSSPTTTFDEKQAYKINVNNVKQKLFEILGDLSQKEKNKIDTAMQELNRESNVVNNNNLDVSHIIKMIHKAGGKTVLAHPEMCVDAFDVRAKKHGIENEFVRKLNDKQATQLNVKSRVDFKTKVVEELISKLVNRGVIGIELYHKANVNREMFETLQRIAATKNLYVTGGSDLHGRSNNTTAFSVGQIFDTNALQKVYNKKARLEADVNSIVLNCCQFVDDWELGEIGNEDTFHWSSQIQFLSADGKYRYGNWSSYHDFIKACSFSDVLGEIPERFPYVKNDMMKETYKCTMAAVSVLVGHDKTKERSLLDDCLQTPPKSPRGYDEYTLE